MERQTRETVNPVVTAALTVLSPYRSVTITPAVWYELLNVLYSIVHSASRQVASLSRTRYDILRQNEGLPFNPIDLQVPSFQRFASDMDEAYRILRKPEATQADVERAAMRAARTVENAGRRTTISAVEGPDDFLDSPEAKSTHPHLVKGWARVATGRETCGWCMMLVSRGPVYHSEQSAGGGASEQRNAWHDGCDCKVVPVFDLRNWEGRDRYLAAQEMWRKETAGYYGQDAINAMRRAEYAGKYDEYLAKQRAALAA